MNRYSDIVPRSGAKRLNTGSLQAVSPLITIPRYERSPDDIGIVHFGPGAFHRAHQAVYVDDLLAKGVDGWAICGVSLRSAKAKDILSKQDFLYTLAILDCQVQYRVIGSIFSMLVAKRQRADVLGRLTDPRTRIVSLTITEKGYCLTLGGDLNVKHPDVAADLCNPKRPETAVGYIVEALRQRRKQNIPAFTPLSCDNLTGNGDQLSNAVLQFAGEIDRDLASWIADNVSFPNTMADSITPASDEKLRHRVGDALLIEDDWPVQREAFTQWILEDRFVNGRPPWDDVGVTMAPTLAHYEKAKLRLLNGAHSSLAYLGLLRGYTTVRQAIADPVLYDIVSNLMRGEIAASLKRSPIDVVKYVDSILCRFENPEIEHRLSQIAWDGSQKLPVRIMGTVRDNVATNRPVYGLAVGIAAWMHFVRRQTRRKEQIVDPLEGRLNEIANQCTGRAHDDVDYFARLSEVFDFDLLMKSPFRRALVDAYSALANDEWSLLAAACEMGD